MIYEWECQRCSAKVTVLRKVANRDQPPSGDELPSCQNVTLSLIYPAACDWQRLITGGKAFFVPEHYNPETGRE